MKWPWRRPRRENHRRSIDDAKRRLEQVERQQPKVERLAAELDRKRRSNHFSEQVRHALGGR